MLTERQDVHEATTAPHPHPHPQGQPGPQDLEEREILGPSWFGPNTRPQGHESVIRKVSLSFMVGAQAAEAHAVPIRWQPQPWAGRDTVSQLSTPLDLGRAFPSFQGPLS